MIVAWWRAIDQVLDDGGVRHGEGGEEEAPSDARDGFELDADASKEWVDEPVHDGDEDDDGERVDILHDVVGDAVQLHGAGWRASVCASYQQEGGDE